MGGTTKPTESVKFKPLRMLITGEPQGPTYIYQNGELYNVAELNQMSTERGAWHEKW